MNVAIGTAMDVAPPTGVHDTSYLNFLSGSQSRLKNSVAESDTQTVTFGGRLYLFLQVDISLVLSSQHFIVWPKFPQPAALVYDKGI